MIGNGPPRVGGVLVLTRAFGNYKIRDCGIITDPYVLRTEVTEDMTHVVIATDGLWDMFKAEDCIPIIEAAATMEEAAKNLVEGSIMKGSRDNTAAWVLKI
jgi:serine/threonine protein phosphatase PrpC